MADTLEPSGLSRHDIMKPAEVAAMLGVPVSTVLYWGREGVLPRVKFGKHVRFFRAHVLRAILDAESGQEDADDDRPPDA